MDSELLPETPPTGLVAALLDPPKHPYWLLLTKLLPNEAPPKCSWPLDAYEYSSTAELRLEGGGGAVKWFGVRPVGPPVPRLIEQPS